MADGSAHTSTPAAVETISAPVLIDQEWTMDLDIPEDMDYAEGYFRMSERYAQMTGAVLRVALSRGENDSDLPGTFSDAVHGAAILLQLSLATSAVGRKLMGEKDHG